MISLYDQLLALNSIPGAYEAWADYRGALTSFVTAHAKGGGPCLIVGAGACNDLDLRRLAAHFGSVTLLDTDTAALARAVKRSPAGHISVLEADLLGVSAPAYRAFDSAVQQSIRAGKSGEALTEEILAALERIWAGARPDPLPEADTVVCCGVHSQLLAMFARMTGVYAQYAAFDAERVWQRISRQNALFQPSFNDRLLASARETLLLGLETERRGVPGGIEGAAQALEDLDARVRAPAAAELLWPFDAAQGKYYTVRLMAVKTRPDPMSE